MKFDATIGITPDDANWPRQLTERLREQLPLKLWALGNLDILSRTKTALFCSTRCPGEAILRAYDQVAKWRDAGRCVISGFHSPVEKECLDILLRGSQPVIICPARSLENMRLPVSWQKSIADGRLLILSCFDTRHNRVTTALAIRRNEFIAAVSDEVWFAHIAPGGEMQRLANCITARD